jgi:hypothetical protein
MGTVHKLEKAEAKVVAFARRKPTTIDPELKSFLDECVIPLLIREALAEKPKKTLETQPRHGADCDPMDVSNNSAGALR